MGLFLPTSQLNQQPQYPAAVARGNPLAQGLVFAGYPLQTSFHDAVTGYRATSGSSAGIVAQRTIDGNLALSREARTTSMTFPLQSTGLDALVGKFTLFAEGSVFTNGTAQLVADSFSSTSGNGVGLKFDDANQVTNGFYLFCNNSNESSSNFDVLGANSEQFKHRVMITGDGTNVKLYAKGLLDRTVANTAQPAAATNRQTRIINGTGGALSLFLAWNRVLSLEEFKALYFNPWQLFQAPRRKTIFYAITGALQALSGSLISSDERPYSGAMANVTSVSGQAISTDEVSRSGAMAVTTRALSGAFLATDEKVPGGGISSLPYTALWTSPASTNLGSVKPATAPSGSGSYLNVMTSWSGGCFGGGYFFVMGGGHTDYAGNEIYGLPISNYTPVLLRQPCSNAIIAGSSTIEASGCYATAATGNTPDPQQVRSQHTYSRLQWSSVKSKMVLFGCAGVYSAATPSATVRYYDPVANTWETGPDILTPFDGAYSPTCEDASGNLWFAGQGSGGRLNRIVPSTGVVTEFGNAFMYSLPAHYRTGIHDPVNNRFWAFGGDGLGSFSVGYWDLTNLSGFVDFTPVTPTGATTLLGVPCPGVAWYAADNKFVLWNGGTTVTVFDPTTFACLSVTLNSANVVTPTAAEANGTFGRFRAIGPDTFLGVNSMDQNFYKLQLRGSDQNLSGTLSTTDSVSNPGILGAGTVGITGQFSPTDSAANPGTIGASGGQALSGVFSPSDSATFAGTASPGAVGLAGQFSNPDSIANPGQVAASINLPGVNTRTDETTTAGSVSPVTSLQGQTVATDERNNAGSAGMGALAIPGQFAATDEATRIGTAAPGALNLPGQTVSTDEKTQGGTIAPTYAITGQFIPTDSGFFLASLAMGALNLGGQFSATQEAMAAGTVGLSSGPQSLTGQFAASDESARAGVAAGATISLTGTFSSTNEASFQGAMALVASLQGQGILSDEQFRQATAALGGVNLAGQVIKTDEQNRAGQVQALIGLLGASFKSDEKTLGGLFNFATSLLGSFLPTDESQRTAIVTVGGVTLIGRFSGTDEYFRLSVIATGQIITKNLRVRGSYSTLMRAAGPYATTIRVIGRYDNG